MIASPATATDGLPLAPLNHQSCLGVDRSATGQQWVLRRTDERLAEALAQRLAVPEIVGRVLAGRGVGLGEAETFLDPTLKALLPDPAVITDMDRAAHRLAGAVMDGEPVTVFADYDADGATSAAVLSRFLAAVGCKPGLYVPDRLAEGYGPTAAAMEHLAKSGASLVVTVDCGASAFGALDRAAALGLDIIVVDHHAVDDGLPKAAAIINPNRPDDTSGLGQLAAVGVTFMLVIATNRALRDRGWYTTRSEPDLRQWLDLVALGTVCDMVPLTGINRALVTQGFKVMAQWGNAGLKALAAVARLNEPPSAEHAGFVFGPRINAAGRVGEAGLGARLLLDDDPHVAIDLARRLDRANRDRRSIEAAVLKDALARCALAAEQAGPIMFAAGEDWHPGVVGIVASRLVDRFRRPACVLAIRDGVAVGSGRSVAGVDLGAAVIAAREAGLLLRGGGHAMAAGFTVAVDGLSAFKAFLMERLDGAVADATRSRFLVLDGAIKVSADVAGMADHVARMAPFGIGNVEPRFAVSAARVGAVAALKGGHVRCTLSGATGGRLPAIAFRAGDGPVAAALLRHDGAPLHLAGRLRRDSRTGRGSLIIDDVASPFPAPA